MVSFTFSRTRAMTFSSSGEFNTSSMSSAMRCIISSLAPRVVMAAVPRRIPDVWKAERAVEWNHVLVYSDVGCNKRILSYFTCEVWIFTSEVNEHRVVVCTTTHDAESTTDEVVSENGCVLLHLQWHTPSMMAAGSH